MKFREFALNVGIFFLASTVAWAGESIRILSDIDDTVKITHVGHVESAVRATVRLHAFAGMSTLYRELLGAEEASSERLIFLSGSARFLGNGIRSFLASQGFPRFELFTRNNLFQPEIFDFKVGRLSAVLERARVESPEARFLLIGDDTEKDPQSYQEIARRHPGQIRAIYIRKVWGRAPLEGQRSFYTALDIALQEVADGRLSAEGAARVAESLLRESLADPENSLLPDFASCPRPGWLAELVPTTAGPELPELMESALLIQGRVEAMCAERLAREAAEREARREAELDAIYRPN